MNDWEEVLAFACSLPDVEMAKWLATLCPKINGKVFMSPGREAGSFALMVTHPEKQILLQTDPDTFWETAHYRNYPMLLVRYDTPAHDRIEFYIQRAWGDRAKQRQRAAAGMTERP